MEHWVQMRYLKVTDRIVAHGEDEWQLSVQMRLRGWGRRRTWGKVSREGGWDRVASKART